MMRRAIMCSALAAVFLGLAACSRDAAAPTQNAARQAVPVRIAQVVQRDMPEEIRTVGNVESIASITIKPQVDGQLVEAHIDDGQDVKAGQTLFLIDRRPFEAVLAEAQAALAKDQAMADDAARAALQMADAFQNRAIAQREADKAKAAADAARAQVQSDQATIDAAKLKLEYCTIKASQDGRAGSLMVKPGNVVEANKTELVQINQIAPVYVSFAVPEQNLPRIRAQQAQAPLLTQALIPGESSAAISGQLTFIDNKVDAASGTIRLKATFANSDRRLWPGQFINIVLFIVTERNAVVAPASAVQSSQKGSFVFVVKPDMTVEQRLVTVGRTVGDQSVISQGLAAGETVVTDGQLRLVPGALIEAKQPEPQSTQRTQRERETNSTSSSVFSVISAFSCAMLSRRTT